MLFLYTKLFLVMVVIGIKNGGCDFLSIPYFFVRFNSHKHLFLSKSSINNKT